MVTARVGGARGCGGGGAGRGRRGAGPGPATLGPLVEPLAFLALAVPLAVLLDQQGAFGTAALADRAGRLDLGLWVLAAVAVAVLDLDAAVVR